MSSVLAREQPTISIPGFDTSQRPSTERGLLVAGQLLAWLWNVKYRGAAVLGAVAVLWTSNKLAAVTVRQSRLKNTDGSAHNRIVIADRTPTTRFLGISLASAVDM